MKEKEKSRTYPIPLSLCGDTNIVHASSDRTCVLCTQPSALVSYVSNTPVLILLSSLSLVSILLSEPGSTATRSSACPAPSSRPPSPAWSQTPPGLSTSVVPFP